MEKLRVRGGELAPHLFAERILPAHKNGSSRR
jgi:hypothetical protein